jgi:6-phosphogluconolactonase
MIGALKNFESPEELAEALSDAVGRALSQMIAQKGFATLAVSGGTTPQRFFKHLSNEDIDWSKIAITLVDERQVDETSPRSNARLVKAFLQQGKAGTARFVPLHRNVAAAQALDLDVVVLGMGSDGHTASFFPGGDRLAEALDPATRAGIVEMSAPGAGEPRLTFTLSKLLASSRLFLHIEGQEKQVVLEKAKSGGDVMDMPIRAVLYSDHPVNIYWCP